MSEAESWGKEWSTACTAVGMKGMGETWPCDPQGLANDGMLQEGEARSFRGSGKTWVPLIERAGEGRCGFCKIVVHLALDVLQLMY